MITILASNESQIIAGGNDSNYLCLNNRKLVTDESMQSDPQDCCMFCCISYEADFFSYDGTCIKCKSDPYSICSM